MPPLQYLYRQGASGSSNGIIVLLHGFGSSADDLFGLAPYIDNSFEFYCLQAPYPQYSGRKWFSLEINGGGVSYDVNQARVAMESVCDTVRELQTKHGFSLSETILGGFSQGAIISSAIILNYGDIATNAWLMSGASIPELVPASPAKYDSSPRVLVQHGLYDEVLTIARGEESVRVLQEKLHPEIEFKTYPIAHSVSAEGVQDANLWLKNSYSSK